MINWQIVVLNLRRARGSLSEVAKETRLDLTHLQRLARGEVAEPRFNSGMKLLDAHEKHCRDRHTLERIGANP